MLTGPIGKFVRKDYLSLIVWQLANYAMPLALITYFSRVLGVKGFGIYGIALGVLNACMVITDWGFLYTSQRALVEASGDIGREQEIIWETGTAKFLLAILCSMALCIGANGVGFHSPYALPLLAGIPALFASAVSQEWILRGKEKFLAFALSSVVGRAVSIPFAFLVVKTADDAVWAIASVSVGQLGASLLSVMLSDTRKYTVPRISILHALTRIKDGLPLFIPIAAVNLFSVMLPPLIGLTSGPVEAGIYSGADRIRGAARMLFYPLTVVAYPKINALRIKDPIALKSYLSKLIAIVFFGSAVVCGLIMLLAKSFIYVLLGHKFQDAIVVLQVLALSAFFSSLSNLLGTNVLVSFGMKRAFLQSQLIGIAIGGTAVLSLAVTHGALGGAAGVLLGEVATLLGQVLSINRNMPWVFGRIAQRAGLRGYKSRR